jgi:hypothetical protein
MNEMLKFGVKMSDFMGETEDDFKTRYIKPPKCREIPEHKLKYRLAEELAKNIKPEKDCRYFVIVDGKFIAGDFIEAFVVEHDLSVEKMTISTLSMSENNVDSLANLLNGGFVKELNLIVSDYFFSHERQSLIPYIYKELDKDNRFQLAAASTHCKTCLIETTDGMFFIIHGSANLRSSSNLEQFVIEESRELYDFNNEYQARVIEKYKTIKKSVRYENLWNTINF